MNLMKLLRKIIISICLGLAVYVGYNLSLSSSDIAIGVMPAIIATASSIGALFINDLVDVIKKK